MIKIIEIDAKCIQALNNIKGIVMDYKGLSVQDAAIVSNQLNYLLERIKDVDETQPLVKPVPSTNESQDENVSRTKVALVP